MEFSPGENSFAWVRAGRSPARTHAKPIPGTGREHRRPAEVRTRPPPRYNRVLSVHQAWVGGHNRTPPSTNGRDARPCAHLNRQSSLSVDTTGRAGLRPAPTNLARGENVGASPRRGPVRRQGIPEGKGSVFEIGVCCSLPRRELFCVGWAGEARPPHTKLFPCTGREHRRPAEVRTRPPPRYNRVLSIDQRWRIEWISDSRACVTKHGVRMLEFRQDAGCVNRSGAFAPSPATNHRRSISGAFPTGGWNR